MRRMSSLIVLCIVAAMTLGFMLLGIIPGRRTLAAAQAEVRKIQIDFTAEDDRLKAMNDVDHELVELRTRTRTFSRRIPPEHALGDFLKDLAVIFERNGLENHIFQPRPTHPFEETRLPETIRRSIAGIQVQPLLVQCEGRFEALFNSMRELEAMPRLSQIDSLKLTTDPQQPGRIKIEMLINILFLPAAHPESARS